MNNLFMKSYGKHDSGYVTLDNDWYHIHLLPVPRLDVMVVPDGVLVNFNLSFLSLEFECGYLFNKKDA